MPLFEYTCRQCGHQFEALVRGQERPACPACQGPELERRISAFAAHTPAAAAAGPAVAMGGCGQCGDPRGPGACSLN